MKNIKGKHLRPRISLFVREEIKEAYAITRIKESEIYNICLVDFLNKSKQEQKDFLTVEVIENYKELIKQKDAKEVQIKATREVFEGLKKLEHLEVSQKHIINLIMYAYVFKKELIFNIRSLDYQLNRNTLYSSKKTKLAEVKLAEKTIRDLRDISNNFAISLSNLVKLAVEQYRTKRIVEDKFKKINIKHSIKVQLKETDIIEIRANSGEEKIISIADGALDAEIVAKAVEHLIYSDYYTSVFLKYLLEKQAERYEREIIEKDYKKHIFIKHKQ